MTYYEKYSASLLFITLIIVAGGLIFAFRRKISSLIDPLLLNMIWCASCVSILVGYAAKYGINGTWSLFMGTFIVYVPFLYAFLKPPQAPKEQPKISESEDRLTLKLYLVSLVLALYSSWDFILYALRSSPVEWVLYRFVQLGARNPLQFIAKLGAYPFFYFFSFWLIQQQHAKKNLIRLILFFVLFLDLLTAGRSQLINVITAYGLFLYKSPPVAKPQYLRKINIYGALGIFISMVWAVLIASLYNTGMTLEDGLLAMVNRIVAAGDGLEMYLVNQADRYINTGIVEYTKSAFGIFISNIFKIPTKSLGWQLFELESGLDSAISLGPNFILPLQVVMFGGLFLIPYTIFMAYLTAKLRGFSFSGIAGKGLSYGLAYYCFIPSLDMEFGTMTYISLLFVYFVFLFPLAKFRLKLPRIRLRWS
ncbi:hypothetical protein [Tellurirhabdus bombi]|uniref:hypothetical protein n=1 Tax=Tellurirhabdus bombi TaxID=2907205 RepID=UPI001F1D105B|nr:hypothetical protein [Tellurirhabdus bombi]